jgi:hypothetical protein
MGWSFVDAFRVPVLGHGKLISRVEGDDATELHEDGGIRFTAPLERFRHFSDEPVGKKLWHLALLEFPTSVFRLASAVYRDFGSSMQRVLADLAVVDLSGWSLKPRGWAAEGSFREGNDFFLEEPIQFRREEIVEEPDRCAFRILRPLYQAFGFPEGAIREFDRMKGRLVLP